MDNDFDTSADFTQLRTEKMAAAVQSALPEPVGVAPAAGYTAMRLRGREVQFRGHEVAGQV